MSLSKWIALFGLGLVGVGLGVLLGAPLMAARGLRAFSQKTMPIPLEDAGLMRDAFRYGESWRVKEGTRILLLPHHLVGAKGIASLVRATPEPTTVYYLAPDHFSGGKTAFSTTKQNFHTKSGRVEVDAHATDALLSQMSSLTENDRAFTKEPSGLAPIPYFKQAWPNAKIVPILVRLSSSEEEQKALASALVLSLQKDERVLLVSTIDFSHYQTAEVADYHDELAKDALFSLDGTSATALEIDSPPIFGMTSRVARELGLGSVTIHDHTNSLVLTRSEFGTESTSHLYASFAPGSVQSRTRASLLVLGSLGASAASSSVEMLCGVEGRFCSGQEARLIPENSEVTRLSTELAHRSFQSIGADKRPQVTEIRTMAYPIAIVSMKEPDVREDWEASWVAFAQTITKEQREGKRVIAWVEWRQGEADGPSEVQRRTANVLLDSGAEAVLGVAPAWKPSLASYMGKPVVFSLNSWGEGRSEPIALGLLVEKEGISLHLLPLTPGSSPCAQTAREDRARVLEAIASRSDERLQDQIRQGILKLIPLKLIP